MVGVYAVCGISINHVLVFTSHVLRRQSSARYKSNNYKLASYTGFCRVFVPENQHENSHDVWVTKT